jgi:adenylate cyclase
VNRLNQTAVPILLAAAVVALVSAAELLPRWLPVPGRPGESRIELFRRLEWITYDWRMRLAAAARQPIATNLAAVFIDDQTLTEINQETGYYWPWPRQLFGRLLRELQAQGARAVACDVFFLERHPDFTETRVRLANGEMVASDQFLADQLRAAGNVILGCPGEILRNQWHALAPAALFRTNALALGDASASRDSDGVLRRAFPFRDDPVLGRVWHLGLRLAAVELGLDLARARKEPHRLVLPGPGDLVRSIPLDADGCFYLDWSLGWYDKRLVNATFEELLEFDRLRQAGATNLEPALKNRLVVIGSIGTGNNISDLGASPVAKETFLLSKHWNVANSLLGERFIRPPAPAAAVGMIVLMGSLSALATWRARALRGTCLVAVLGLAYVGLGVWLFLRFRYWLPLVLPVGGAMFMAHVALVTWRAVFEQTERRRVKSVFARIVAPEVVNELLGQRELSLGGTLREVTVLFADVRGFTRLTDENQKAAEEQVRRYALTGAASEAWYAQNARETLDTVNVYLAAIADNVKRYGGTLDKYIGDCVMAFWGAPIPNPAHAADAVRAAVDAQRALARLNADRAQENLRREQANTAALAAGGQARPLLALLSLGTGINTGTVTVGLMGSRAHILNYTVFGREVNIASRLEAVSGQGRIICSEATYRELGRWDAALAGTCIALPPVTVKGISHPLSIYEVPWQPCPDRTGEA